MRITLKQNILFMAAVITFSSLPGCMLLIWNGQVIGKELSLEGEAFFAIVRETDQDITPVIEGYLVNNFDALSEAVGGATQLCRVHVPALFPL
ncbi:MAG: hypothetical protein HN366_05990 [Deltaproteobacteria bacterium]|nr:hypothetical protein [Deltaproteobacteria bacterium]